MKVRHKQRKSTTTFRSKGRRHIDWYNLSGLEGYRIFFYFMSYIIPRYSLLGSTVWVFIWGQIIVYTWVELAFEHSDVINWLIWEQSKKNILALKVIILLSLSCLSCFDTLIYVYKFSRANALHQKGSLSTKNTEISFVWVRQAVKKVLPLVARPYPLPPRA